MARGGLVHNRLITRRAWMAGDRSFAAAVSTWILLCTIAVTSAHAAGWSERDVELGGLQGTLTLPDAPAQVPAVLIVAGSGPVDRDGNVPNVRNDSLKVLAHDLASQGIGSLRTDKRGIAGSQRAGAREDDLRFGTYVSDAVAWLAFLRSESRISRVSILGHSEGALVATLVGQHADVDLAGVVLLAGAGEPAGRIIERQLAAAHAPPAMQQTSHRILASLETGQAVADVPPELMALFRPGVQPYLMSWLSLDPAKELAKVARPVLIVQGTTDLQVAPADATRLAESTPAAKLILIDSMNHILRTAPMDRAGNLQTYVRPELPLAQALVPAIAAFLLRL
jgi:pimeloyl-ACP methyl ester carboxylesterase